MQTWPAPARGVVSPPQDHLESYVSPKATLDAISPALLYLGFWYALAACAFWVLGIETCGRSIEEIDGALARSAPASS